MMFTTTERASIRADLLARARQDERIVSGAITGSAAAGHEDDLSDIDLAFGVATGATLSEVLSDWTNYLYRQNAAVHHVDTQFKSWFYRTFLLPNTLQVDLAFVPSDQFQALAPSFQLVFGTAKDAAHLDRPTSAEADAACSSAVEQARACLTRGAVCQADYFLGVARDNALASACLHHDLPYQHARGFDLLPFETRSAYAEAFAQTLDIEELRRAVQIIAANIDRSAPVRAVALPGLVEADRGVGLAWLYALHARSSMHRKKLWQAEFMVRGMRDYTLGLASLRSSGKPGAPLYPDSVTKEIDALFRSSRPRALDPAELKRAFERLIEHLNYEISLAGVSQAQHLRQTIASLI